MEWDAGCPRSSALDLYRQRQGRQTAGGRGEPVGASPGRTGRGFGAGRSRNARRRAREGREQEGSPGPSSPATPASHFPASRARHMQTNGSLVSAYCLALFPDSHETVLAVY